MRNIENIASEMAKSYENTEFAMFSEVALPEKEQIIALLDDIQALFFPAYFDVVNGSWESEEFAEKYISSIYFKLKKSIIVGNLLIKKIINIVAILTMVQNTNGTIKFNFFLLCLNAC